MSGKLKVLVVGQTPPPHHGQAIMIERLLTGDYARVQLFHVRMAFSDSIGDVGRLRFGKVLHLIGVICRIIYERIAHGTTVLYYPPAGGNRVPAYRDVAILLATRWMFRRTVFHFHATGLAELYPRLSRLTQFLVRFALFQPDAAIRITKSRSADADLLRPRRQFVVSNGIEDEAANFKDAAIAHESAAGKAAPGTISIGPRRPANRLIALESRATAFAVCESAPLQILFVGMIRESKGIRVLLNACDQLRHRGIPFDLEIAGAFHSPKFDSHLRGEIEELGLSPHVKFLGVVDSESKCDVYRRADVFCFPTFYEAETFPLVILEAMSFGLPVVATRWRGIPEIVDDGRTGFLVDVQDATAVADRLEQIAAEPELGVGLGTAGREKFSRDYTAERFCQRMEDVFVEAAACR